MQMVLKVNFESKKPVVFDAEKGILGCSCMKCRGCFVQWSDIFLSGRQFYQWWLLPSHFCKCSSFNREPHLKVL